MTSQTHPSTNATMKNKRLLGILGVIVTILLIPAIAMQFSTEVNWSLFDFVIAGILLLLTGLAIEFVLRKVSKKYQIILVLTILGLFLLIWIELAVGIFGTPFAGS